MAQKSAQNSVNFLTVIDFNEKIRQVSSLLTLYKYHRVRYNIQADEMCPPDRFACFLTARLLRTPRDINLMITLTRTEHRRAFLFALMHPTIINKT
jgi:hypothetical protein